MYVVYYSLDGLRVSSDDVGKRQRVLVTGFQTGSGQTGSRRRATNPLHVAIRCFMCARVATVCHMFWNTLPHAPHILRWKLMMGNRVTSVTTPCVPTPSESCQEQGTGARSVFESQCVRMLFQTLGGWITACLQLHFLTTTACCSIWAN